MPGLEPLEQALRVEVVAFVAREDGNFVVGLELLEVDAAFGQLPVDLGIEWAA